MSILLLFFPSTNISTRLDQILRNLNQQNINNGESNENNQCESQISLIVTHCDTRSKDYSCSRSVAKQDSQARQLFLYSKHYLRIRFIRCVVRAHVFSRPVLPPGGV